MITINLQWLALPLAIFALYHIGWAVWSIQLLFGSEIAPLIGVASIYQHLPWGVGAAVVAILTYYAFRTT